MPKTEVRYDVRMQIKLEADLKRKLEDWARCSGISTNHAARLAFERLVKTKPVELAKLE